MIASFTITMALLALRLSFTPVYTSHVINALISTAGRSKMMRRPPRIGAEFHAFSPSPAAPSAKALLALR